MTRRFRALFLAAIALALILIVTWLIGVTRMRAPWTPPPIVLEGSVLTQNVDPAQRTPLDGVNVTAMGRSTSVQGKSDPTGYFHLILDPGVKTGETVTLTFQKPDFQDLEIDTTKPGDQLYIAQMRPVEHTPVPARSNIEGGKKAITITNVRVRYTSKDVSTVAVGSIAKQFPAYNAANVPCRNRRPCSPDGRWKATLTTLPFDADYGNEFRNVRVSCIAGPCHFTRIDSAGFAKSARKIAVSVLGWSGTTDFLVEADVVRTMTTDIVRLSYPFTIGETMNFGLPAGSEGPSVEADLDGSFIVFPLGPDLILTWATCSEETSPDGNKICRCRLKPGYHFQE